MEQLNRNKEKGSNYKKATNSIADDNILKTLVVQKKIFFEINGSEKYWRMLLLIKH